MFIQFVGICVIRLIFLLLSFLLQSTLLLNQDGSKQLMRGEQG